MDVSSAIKAQLNRYDAARRGEILREATAAAQAENRQITITDIRLAGIPKKYRTRKAAEKPATPPLFESTAVILDTLPQRLKPIEVAAYLGVSEDLVMTFKDTGRLTFINIAAPGAKKSAWRITRESVAAFEASRKTGK